MADGEKDRPQITLSSNSNEQEISPLDIRATSPLATGSGPLGPSTPSKGPPPSAERALPTGDLSQFGYRNNHPEPPPPITEPPSKASVSGSVPHGKFPTLDDVIVLVVCECLAVPLNIAAGEAVVAGHYGGAALGWGLGIPLAVAGFTFHWWKNKLSVPARNSIQAITKYGWPVALLAAFLYVVGPDMYRRATQPVALSGAIGVMPIGTIAVGPIPPSAEPKFAEDLNWNDALVIESAFLHLPRPCAVKLSATSGNFNARNILRAIIVRNAACEIVDDQKDLQAGPVDVDAPPDPKINGLIVRWNESYSGGEEVFRILSGFLKVVSGHKMPPDSPTNLIWIQVGDGYPWKQ